MCWNEAKVHVICKVVDWSSNRLLSVGICYVLSLSFLLGCLTVSSYHWLPKYTLVWKNPVSYVSHTSAAWALQNCSRPATKGLYYRGNINVTENGTECQNWLTSSPHAHSETPQLYPNAGLGDHNYCRNPGSNSSQTKPWCYTTSISVVWQYCDIPECPPGEEHGTLLLWFCMCTLLLSVFVT